VNDLFIGGFIGFPKLARLNREATLSEKIDGTNAQVFITPISKDSQDPSCLDYWYGPDASTWGIYAGSRTRWIHPGDDNYGFAVWVKANVEALKKLGPGRHFGEWWGRGIQRNYGLTERRFSLFNAGRWVCSQVDSQLPGVYEVKALEDGTLVTAPGPECCYVVPTIWRGNFDLFDCRAAVEMLRNHGSFAVPGWKTPEGIVVYHEAAKQSFKVTLVGDESPKSLLTKPEPVRD